MFKDSFEFSQTPESVSYFKKVTWIIPIALLAISTSLEVYNLHWVSYLIGGIALSISAFYYDKARNILVWTEKEQVSRYILVWSEKEQVSYSGFGWQT